MFRALAVVRVVVLLNAVALNVYRAPHVDHPPAVAGVLLAMAVWTGFAVWAYADVRRRSPALLLADLAVAEATLLATPMVKGPDFNASIPGFWIAGALIAWAVHWHWRGGLAAAVLLSATDLLVRDHVEQDNYGNVFLMLIAGVVIGFMVESVQRMAAERDAAERDAAAAAERTRLARAVHDGVLQVLALVQRRGRELGGVAAELGRLAGEQEAALRSLIRQQDSVAVSEEQQADLVSALTGLARVPSVTLAAPGVPVLLPSVTTAELTAVVAACLDNVARHVGPDAPAWVLVEALPDRVQVSVRDEGPGIPPGRLDAAATEGRLGVAESIRGRVADLGGTASLITGPSGTEWEFVVPRSASDGPDS